MAASARIDAATRAPCSWPSRPRGGPTQPRPDQRGPGVHHVAAEGVGRLELLAGDAHEVVERQADAEQGEHVADEAHVGVAVAVARRQVVGAQQARRLERPQHLDRHAAALGHLGQPQDLVLVDQPDGASGLSSRASAIIRSEKPRSLSWRMWSRRSRWWGPYQATRPSWRGGGSSPLDWYDRSSCTLMPTSAASSSAR